jgi:hypothetical protein
VVSEYCAQKKSSNPIALEYAMVSPLPRLIDHSQAALDHSGYKTVETKTNHALAGPGIVELSSHHSDSTRGSQFERKAVDPLLLWTGF